MTVKPGRRRSERKFRRVRITRPVSCQKITCAAPIRAAAKGSIIMSTTVETTPRSTRAATMRLTQIAILTALVIVLQLIGSFTGIKIGPFTPTLALFPIIIGAVLVAARRPEPSSAPYSPSSSAIAVVTGADPGGLLMFQENPVVTLLLCMLKGTAADLSADFCITAVRNTSEIAALALGCRSQHRWCQHRHTLYRNADRLRTACNRMGEAAGSASIGNSF